jgi:restriction system protein
MAIPDYQAVVLPLLRFLKDGKEHNIEEVVDSLAGEFNLSPDERQQLLGGGQQTVLRNRAGWAYTYLKKAGLIASTRRGYFRITGRGETALVSKPERMDIKYLEQFPQFLASTKSKLEPSNNSTQRAALRAAADPERKPHSEVQAIRRETAVELTPGSFLVELVSPQSLGGMDGAPPIRKEVLTWPLPKEDG